MRISTKVAQSALVLTVGGAAVLTGTTNVTSAQQGQRATFYVSMNGSDSASGSRTHPFASIRHAVHAVPARSRILVRSGTYQGFQVTKNHMNITGIRGSRVRIRGGAADVIEFDGVRGGALRNVEVRGSRVQYGSAIRVSGSRRVTVQNVSAHDARTYGFLAVDSFGVQLLESDVYGNASGIEERRSSHVRILGNRIHHNLKEVDGARGAEGITFFESDGPILVQGNRFTRNHTHLEVFGSSRLNIQHNRFFNGEIMETGTRGPKCGANRFTRNIAVRGRVGADGMILRCARNMLVAHNVFDAFDDFAIYVVNGRRGVDFGGSIEGLRIVDNIVVHGRAYSIGTGLPGSVNLDFNLLRNAGSRSQYGEFLAYVAGKGNADSLRKLRRWTGYEKHSLSASPEFINARRGNYHLRRSSPAVDAGVALSSKFKGRGSDIGRYESW